MNLNTNYLGLALKSPIIVSSSSLTSTLENLKIAEANGAGAVVLKSLFEEQIMYSVNELAATGNYPEADDYIASYTRDHTVEEYLDLIRDAKKNLGIPVIASINCYTAGAWIDFASKIQDAGADGLEVNAFFLPVYKGTSPVDTEKSYFELAEKLLKKITIPVAIKIGPRFTNILNIVDQFYNRGIKGVVMFNRFFEPDIDIDKLEIVPAPVFSNPFERRYVLRWIAMVSGMGLKINISATTGVSGGEDVVRYLLAGADSVQVCSVLYQKGLTYLKQMNDDIAGWMARNNFDSISDFRGMLNWKNTRKPVVYERSQFMRYFSSID